MKMSKIILAVVLAFGIGTVAYAQDPGVTGHDPGNNPQLSGDMTQGAEIFNFNCSRCHPNGGNIIVPNLPLSGSGKLSDFKTFLAFIRNPRMQDGSEGVMPAFPQRQISDDEAKTLYLYITSSQSTGIPRGGYGTGPGRMGGYGMGPGAMGGYGWGPGMGGYGMGPGAMGGYGMGPGMMRGHGMVPGYGPQYPQQYQQYPQYQQSQKPLDEKDAREMAENYLRSTRNPNLKIGKIEDTGSAFEAEVVTKENSLVDRILIDKATGWMHSAY
jgi:mono/diheme cytochrome c family protein